jgi:hypothetical protein
MKHYVSIKSRWIFDSKLLIAQNLLALGVQRNTYSLDGAGKTLVFVARAASVYQRTRSQSSVFEPSVPNR